MTHVLFIFAGWTLKPGGDTRRRVRAALEYLQAQPRHRGEWYVVCLGGKFNQETQSIAAATRMREWIVAERVLPADHILADVYSRDTFENLSCGFALLKKEGIVKKDRELIIVSHPWHLERIQSILRRVYSTSARMVPVWHYLTWKQRFAEIFLAVYLLVDPCGERWPMRFVRARRARPAAQKRTKR